MKVGQSRFHLAGRAQHPGIFPASSEFRFGSPFRLGGEAGQRPGKKIELIAISHPIDDVILQAFYLAVLDQAYGLGGIFSRLRNEQVGRFPDDITKLVRAAFQILNGKKSFAGEGSDLERFGIFQHKLALIYVAKPIGLDCWQNWPFTEVIANDDAREMQKTAIISELRTDRVD